MPLPYATIYIFVLRLQQIKYYSTKFEPPKKEQRNKKTLSANVKKFLERKEAEERQRAEEARRKKEELLALRAQVTNCLT